MRNRLLDITKRGIPYLKELRPYAGSVTACVLMQQLDHRFAKYPDGFYKFLEPCDHPLCKQDDTWHEELGMSADEFRTAFDRIGVRHKSKGDYDRQVDPFDGKYYCSYHDKRRGTTHYFRNHSLVDALLDAISEGRVFVAEQDSPVTGQCQVTETGVVQLQKPTTPSYIAGQCQVIETDNAQLPYIQRSTSEIDSKELLQRSQQEELTNGSNEPARSFSTPSQEKKRAQDYDSSANSNTSATKPKGAQDRDDSTTSATAANKTAALLRSLSFDDLLKQGKSATTPPTAVQSNHSSTCLAIPLTGTPPNAAPPSPAAPSRQPRNPDRKTVDSQPLAGETSALKQYEVDDEGVIILPGGKDKLARDIALRRMQYLLAFNYLEMAEPMFGDDGRVEAEGREIWVYNRMAVTDDAELEGEAFSGRLSIRALRTYALRLGLRLSNHNDTLQALFNDSCDWLTVKGEQATFLRQNESSYCLFPDDTERFLGMLG